MMGARSSTVAPAAVAEVRICNLGGQLLVHESRTAVCARHLPIPVNILRSSAGGSVNADSWGLITRA